MSNIIENDFRGIDLNLLLVFRALLQERSVTRAAQRLFLGQPAVSAALKRLRRVFDDELFVRTAQGMAPTPRALALSQHIEPLLLTLHAAIKQAPSFDPATAQRVFHIGLSDALEVVLMPALVQTLQREAPGVQLITRNADGLRAPSMLDANDIELAIGVQRGCQSWHRIESLFHWHFVCLYNPQRVGVAGAAITMDEFLQYPHVFTSFSASLRGYVDEQLELMGLQRRVLFSSPGFATSPFIVQRTAALASVPDYIAAIWCQNLGLAVSPLPFPVPEYEVSLLWSVSAEQEPGLRWLRQVVTRCAAEALSPAVHATMADCGPV